MNDGLDELLMLTDSNENFICNLRRENKNETRHSGPSQCGKKHAF